MLEDGVEELARLLGVAVGEQLHRALEVGEEDRHLLALAFERGLGGEDLLGEVLGGIGLRGGELGLLVSSGAVRRTGHRTCLGAGSPRHRTDRVWQGRCGTVPTEFHAWGVHALAPGTLDAGGLRAGTLGPVSDQRRCAPTLPGALRQVKDRRCGRGGQGMGCMGIDRVSAAWRASGWRARSQPDIASDVRRTTGWRPRDAHAGTARLGQAVMHVDGRRGRQPSPYGHRIASGALGASLIDRHPDARRVVDINALSALAPLPAPPFPGHHAPSPTRRPPAGAAGAESCGRRAGPVSRPRKTVPKGARRLTLHA